MKQATWLVLVLALVVLGGCKAWDDRLDGEGKVGCLDCEARCWPPGRICWTDKCLCEEWIEECESAKIRLCGPCDRPETKENAAEPAEASPSP